MSAPRPVVSRRRALNPRLVAVAIALGLCAALAPKARATTDTTSVYGPHRYTSTSTSFWMTYDDEFSTTIVAGRRYIIELHNGTSTGTQKVNSAKVTLNGQEWIGSSEVTNASTTVIREVNNASSDGELSVSVIGPNNAFVDVRVVQVKEPTFIVFPETTFVRPGSIQTQTGIFTLPGAAVSPYTLHVINGSGNGNNRVTNCTVKVNGTQVLSSSDFGTGIATLTRTVTLATYDTLSILNQSSASTQISVWVTASDSTAPVITFTTAPADGLVTTASKVYFVGSTGDETYGTISINGQTALTTPGAFSDSVSLATDQRYVLPVHAINNAGFAANDTFTVIRDTRAPTLTLNKPTTSDTLTDSLTVTVSGTWVDSTATVITVDGDTLASGVSGSFGYAYPLDFGSNRIVVRATDVVGHVTEVMRFVLRQSSSEPSAISADMSGVATDLSETSRTRFFDSVKFLYTGGSPLQTGVTADSLRTDHVAVIRGTVSARDFGALANVTVSVSGHPEFGHVLSREDGAFDLLVNGGGPLTISFSKDGYLDVQRQVTPGWQDYAIMDEVAMVGVSARRTVVNSSAQVVRGRFATDANGDRAIRLSFPSSTVAQVVKSVGDTVTYTAMRVRATEFTVGGDEVKTMPAELPQSSAYTYCVDLRLDEADSIAIATGVKPLESHFTKPVPCYVKNFLHTPIGSFVPLGYYDQTAHAWKADSDGVVIKVVGVSATGDTARIDSRGTGSADTQTRLDSLGVTPDELVRIKSQFAVGDTLWRVRVSHFSIWDLNFNLGEYLASLSAAAGRALKQLGLIAHSCLFPGSIIECENRVLGERFPITGTPFTINYRSFRAPGDLEIRTVRLPVFGSSVPSNIDKVIVQVDVAGRRLKAELAPSANLVAVVPWDGLDVYGRRVQGSVAATVNVGYVSKSTASAGRGGGSFGTPDANGETALGLTIGDRQVGTTQWIRQQVTLGTPGTGSDGLGGWTLSPHHYYDNSGDGAVYLGDGTVMLGDQLRPTISRYMGNGLCTGGGSTLLGSHKSNSIAIGPDGSLYLDDNCIGSILRVDPAGSIHLIAGTGTVGTYTGDGIATATPLKDIQAIALGPDGSVFFAAGLNATADVMVGQVTPDGHIKKLIGGNSVYTAWGGGDGLPAGQAWIAKPKSIAVGRDGSIFIGTADDHRVRRIAPNGIISTYAGTGGQGVVTDSTGPATRIRLAYPENLSVDSQGNLYICDGDVRVFQVSPDGVRRTFLTFGSNDQTHDMTFGPDGCAYIGCGLGGDNSPSLNHVWRRDLDGSLSVVAGGGSSSADGVPATARAIGVPIGIAVRPDGTYFITDGAEIYRVSRTLATPVANEVAIPSPDGNQIYYFSSDSTMAGRHLRTRDALTGAVRYRFTYDGSGRLATVVDASGLTTTIQRDGSGMPTAIVGPFGHSTALGLDGSGHLESLTDPLSHTLAFVTSSDGLLTSFTDAAGNEHTFTYDGNGRLQRDTDPAGGYQNLTPNGAGTTRVSTRTSAEGRTTIYTTTDLGDGTRQRVIQDPRGFKTFVTDSTDMRVHTWTPEGVASTDSLIPDGRFGMIVPLDARTIERLPSSTPKVIEVSDSMTTSFNPPFTHGTWLEKVSVNGRTPSRTYVRSDSLFLLSQSPQGRYVKSYVDSAGRPRTVMSPGLETATYGYDSQGRVIHLQQTGRPWRYTYDGLGRLATATDTLGRRTSFSYDDADRLTSQTLPDSQVVSFSYDANGNLLTVTPPGRSAHRFNFTPINLSQDYRPPAAGSDSAAVLYSYNLDRQLTHLRRPGADSTDLSYESSTGRIQTLTIPRGTSQYSYISAGSAGAGMVHTITSPDAVTLTYTYDGPLPLTETWSGTVAGHVDVTYDRDFRIIAQSVNGSSSVGLSYDLDGLLAGVGIDSLNRQASTGFLDSTSLAGLTATSKQDYNLYGELANLHYSWNGGSLLESMDRDAAGRITTRSEAISGDTTRTYTYIYTTAGRLKEVRRGSNILEHYEYDSNGNRTFATAASPSDTASATYDAQDRLVRFGGGVYAYTTSGELKLKVQNSDTTRYTYDPLGNLVTVRLPSGDRIDYVIDGQGRRVGRKVNGSFKHGWLYQNGLNVVAELDSSGSMVTRYVYGSRGNVPDYMIKSGTTYRIVSDHLGSVRLVVDASTGAVAERIDYDAWGNKVQDSNPGFTSLGFAGGLTDEATGLVRFGARDYDSGTGRWLGLDPIRFAGGSTDLLGYADDDPINRIDPTGTDAQKDLDDIAGTADFVTCGRASRWRDRYFSYNSISKKSAAYRSGVAAGRGIVLALILQGAGGLLGAVGEAGGEAAGEVSAAQEVAGISGEAGSSSSVLVARGGIREAENVFFRLAKDGTDITPVGHPGILARLPSGGTVGFRPTSLSGLPTVDVNLPEVALRKIKFLP